jgi:2-polyprenyl-3-methyl-5-hydroxy-6-metoxy-1,4-benzoquinol methylase
VGLIGGTVGFRILKTLCPGGDSGYLSGEAYANKSKLRVLFGERFFDDIKGKTVIDFGCGTGGEAVEMAQHGARRVIGVDIRDAWLDAARRRAVEHGVSDRCVFMTSPDQRADMVVSLDSFEHFDDPAAILRIMDSYLAPGGKVIATFGPTWYHPLGGHLFSVFPWAHLVFTEHALLRWRKSIRPTQTATRITECGLNKITIRRFERIVSSSPFRFEQFEARPIRGIQMLSKWPLREFGTAIVRCTLVRKAEAAAAAAA